MHACTPNRPLRARPSSR